MRTMRQFKVLAAELKIQRIIAPKASEKVWFVGGRARWTAHVLYPNEAPAGK